MAETKGEGRGVKSFTVALRSDELVALDGVVSAGVEAETKWLTAARDRAGLAGLRGAALSEARRQIRVERARLRARGKFRSTRELVLIPALRAELKSRKLDHDWDEPPSGEIDAPGRRWGTAERRYDRDADDDKRFTGRLRVDLPIDLGERLVRAAYWTSAPAVAKLKAWDARWGDGPEVILRRAEQRGGMTVLDFLSAGLAPRAPVAALRERDELRSQIVTTGDLVRAAVERATSA